MLEIVCLNKFTAIILLVAIPDFYAAASLSNLPRWGRDGGMNEGMENT